jgi:hypothetical protein
LKKDNPKNTRGKEANKPALAALPPEPVINALGVPGGNFFQE